MTGVVKFGAYATKNAFGVGTSNGGKGVIGY